MKRAEKCQATYWLYFGRAVCVLRGANISEISGPQLRTGCST